MSRCHIVATTLCRCCNNIHNTSAGVVDQGLNPTFNFRPDSKGPIKGILLQVGGLFDLQRYVKAHSLSYVIML